MNVHKYCTNILLYFKHRQAPFMNVHKIQGFPQKDENNCKFHSKCLKSVETGDNYGHLLRFLRKVNPFKPFQTLKWTVFTDVKSN